MNLRKDSRYAARMAAWTSQGPAIIEHPLRIIADRGITRDATGAVIVPPFYRAALRHANQGHGGIIKAIARGILG